MKDIVVSELSSLGLRSWKVMIEGAAYRVLAPTREEAARFAAYRHAARNRPRFGRTRYVPPTPDSPAHSWLVARGGRMVRVITDHDGMVGEEPRKYNLVDGTPVMVWSG